MHEEMCAEIRVEILIAISKAKAAQLRKKYNSEILHEMYAEMCAEIRAEILVAIAKAKAAQLRKNCNSEILHEMCAEIRVAILKAKAA